MGEALASIIDPKGCPTMSKPSVGEALASINPSLRKSSLKALPQDKISTLKGLPQFPYSPPEGERTKVGMNF